MCASIADKGWRPVVLNYRGCAGLQLTSPTVYCASFTDDVHLAVEEIHTQYPDARVFAAGYSLGSLILCKYLAECGNGTWTATGEPVMFDTRRRVVHCHAPGTQSLAMLLADSVLPHCHGVQVIHSLLIMPLNSRHSLDLHYMAHTSLVCCVNDGWQSWFAALQAAAFPVLSWSVIRFVCTHVRFGQANHGAWSGSTTLGWHTESSNILSSTIKH